MTTRSAAGHAAALPPTNPWPALWAMVLGFFMILVDSTIVQVATPSIMSDLGADVGQVIWVNSAYLLAYAVPLLITGRLGDRLGPRQLYLVGLALFTAASLWCGLTGSVEGLIVARVFQGLGASMMTPQTMSVITRTFPAARRGQAMALWGATAHGVSERRILWKHALRGAAVPIVTILGMKMIGLTSGTVLVESVFVIPGFAGYSVNATLLHDLPVVQAITLIFTIVIIVTNLIVELVYARLNVKESA